MILNTANGKRYVGSSVQTKRRWISHKTQLRRQVHGNPHLQSAWNKYGESAFVFSILEEVQNESDLVMREQYWMDATKSRNPTYGYNKVDAGDHQTPECRKRQSERMSGTQIPQARRDQQSVKMKRHWSTHTHPCSGKPLSKERRQKQAAITKARYDDPDNRKKVSESFKSLWQDPNHIELMKKKSAASWDDPEVRERRSTGIKTYHANMPVEAKAKRSEQSRRNGYTRAANLTQEERSAFASKAAVASWEKRRANPELEKERIAKRTAAFNATIAKRKEQKLMMPHR